MIAVKDQSKALELPRSQWPVAAAISATLVLTSMLGRVHFEWGFLALGSSSVVFLVNFRKPWREFVPIATAPWYRIVLVAVLLLVGLTALTVLAPEADASSQFSLEDQGRLAHLIIALLMVPTALFHEFFVRGLLYTMLERWRGTVAAVVGTILFSLLIATPFIWRDAVAAEILIVEGFVLAASRWLTGSVAPALIAQGVQAGIGAAFLVVVALSSTG